MIYDTFIFYYQKSQKFPVTGQLAGFLRACQITLLLDSNFGILIKRKGTPAVDFTRIDVFLTVGTPNHPI